MVLQVEGGEVGNVIAEGFDGGADFGSESRWGENGQCAGLETDCGEV